jgi:hypothetical protein
MKPLKIKEMRALSIAQPWAHCIIRKGKNVENRNWTTRYRGTIAIHASLSRSKDRFYWCEKDYGIKLDPDELSYGAIVGFAEIVDVITKKDLTTKTKKWFGGKYGFVLKNIVTLKKPIPIKGALGFWKLKGRKLKKCLKQLKPADRRKFIEFKKLDKIR